MCVNASSTSCRPSDGVSAAGTSLALQIVAPPIPIFAIYPSRKHLSAKVRAFVDFLLERFAQAQDWSAA